MEKITKRIGTMMAALGLVVGLAAAAAPAHAGLPANVACAVAKRKAAVNRMRALDKCFAKRESDAQPPDTACLDAVDQKFEHDFQRIEAKGGCIPATGDGPAVGRFVDQCETRLVEALGGSCLPAGSECGGVNRACCEGHICGGPVGQTPTCR